MTDKTTEDAAVGIISFQAVNLMALVASTVNSWFLIVALVCTVFTVLVAWGQLLSVGIKQDGT